VLWRANVLSPTTLLADFLPNLQAAFATGTTANLPVIDDH
jgi:hypothetical protein